MKALLTWLLTLLLMIPTTQPLAMPINAILNKEKTETVSGNAVEEPPIQIEEAKEMNLEDKILNSMITLDLEGYATIGYPVTYFTYNNTESTGVYKQLDYTDGKSRIYMSYITGMAVGADIPGYIANDLAKVNTYTNNKVEEEEHNGIEWMKITADNQIDDCNVYVYYALNSSGTSAFWMKVKVRPEEDNETFNTILDKMLNSFDMYAPSGEFIFNTPDSGYYSEHDVSDETEADTSEYVENNENDNQVFKYKGGYVLGADIADNWDELEIILDGEKFHIPSSLYKFLDAGYTVNDESLQDLLNSIHEEDDRSLDNIELSASQTISLTLENENGTVVTLDVRNGNASEKQLITNCDVVGITVDSSRFIDTNKTAEDEYYNEMTEIDEYASQNAKDDYNHELILARGITWDAYVDEIERIYTTGSFTESPYSTEQKSIVFKNGPKTMELKMGNVKGISYIKLSCAED